MLRSLVIRVEMKRLREKWVPPAFGVPYPPYLVRCQNTVPLRHRFPIPAITGHLAHGIDLWKVSVRRWDK